MQVRQGIQLDACMSGVFKTRHPCGCLQETKERSRRFKRIVNLYEKAAGAAIEETGKTQKDFSVRSVLNVLQHCGIPHMIVCSEMLLCSEQGFVLPRQPFAAADAAHTGPAPNPHAGVDMRKRTQGINVRVTTAEKCKIERSAAGCGLTVSEYLRRRALGYTPKFHPPPDFSAPSHTWII